MYLKGQDEYWELSTVSVLPSLSKIFENVVAYQLSRYFEDHFSSYLAGFRKGYSCYSTLLRLLEDWKLALDKKHVVGAILMDLSKAFDCMPYDLLVAKLMSYSVGHQTVSFIGNYLSNRKQRIKMALIMVHGTKLLKECCRGLFLVRCCLTSL